VIYFIHNKKFSLYWHLLTKDVLTMKEFASANIKNVVLLGHGGSGKTTLADALLFNAGLTDRIGGPGATVMDFDPEEKKRSASVGLSVYPIVSGDLKINLMDAPGQFDFVAGDYEIRETTPDVGGRLCVIGQDIDAHKIYALMKG
jgi:translation elongation factor EF-4